MNSSNTVSVKLVTISVLEDDLIVGEEKLRHDIRVFPVQPQGALCRGHDPALLQPKTTQHFLKHCFTLLFFKPENTLMQSGRSLKNKHLKSVNMQMNHFYIQKTPYFTTRGINIQTDLSHRHTLKDLVMQ